MPKLLIKKGESVVKKLLIPDNIEAFTVGCEKGNDIIIADEAISFFHLQIEKQSTEYFVRDLQSQWGTFVNGKKISSKTPLHHHDNIRLGNHLIVFFEENATTAQQKAQATGKAANKVRRDNQNETNRVESNIATPPSYPEEEKNESDKPSDVVQNFSQNGRSHNHVADPDNSDTADKPYSNGYQSQDTDYDIGSIPSDYDISTTYSSKDISINTDESYSDEQHRTEPSYTLPSNSILQNEFEPGLPNAAPSVTPSTKDNYYLLCIHGYYIGRKFKIKTPETRIGRDRKLNDIIIKKNSKGDLDQSVSRRHATLKFRKNNWYLSDKRSKSRTWLNRHELGVEEEAKVHLNDEIEIKSDKKSHIFRIVENENWDYSFPRKAGVWYLRNSQKLIYSFSLIFILWSLITFTTSFFAKNIITQQPYKLEFKEQLWTSKEAAARFNSVNNQTFSSFPATGDVDSDGFLDLVFVNSNGNVSCINGKTKDILWTNTDFEAIRQIPVLLKDLYGKGMPDIIAISKEHRVRIIDGSWGIEIGKSPILAGPLTGTPAIGDFNGDGFQDIAIASAQNAIYLALSSIKDFNWTKIELEHPINSILSVGDITNDGLDNIFLGTENGKLLVLDGLGRRIMNSIDINEELNKALGTFVQDNQVRFPVTISDVNGDAAADLIVVTEQGNLITLSGLNLNRLWCDFTNDTTRLVNNALSVSSGDLDADGLYDIVVQSASGTIKALKGATGGKDRKLTLWEKNHNNRFWGNPVLADFNKNGSMDVLVTNESGIITIFEGSSGQILSTYTAGQKIKSQPLIGSFDNENNLDILFLKEDGKFYKLASNSSIPNKAVVWGQTYGNGQNTNTSPYQRARTQPFYVKMGVSVTVILLVLLTNYLVIRSRKKFSYY